MNLPVTPFDGFLRQIRRHELDVPCGDTIDFVCKRFFGRDVANEEGNSAAKEFAQGFKIPLNSFEKPFAFRRLAGDPLLQRGRYYTVASDEKGKDGGTLVGELSAYSDLESAGPVWIHDTNELLPPELSYGQHGGSPITDAIGRYLRTESVEAIVFPSARSDVRVDIRNGIMQNWIGWNLLDYRNSPMPHTRLAVVVNPKSWRDPLTFKLNVAPDAHEYSGSFSLEGVSETLFASLATKAALNQGV